MKKAILSFILVLLASVLYAQTVIVHDPNAALRTVAAFRSINVSDAIDLYISQGDEEGIAVSAADSRSRERIRTSVENGVLKIRCDKNAPGSSMKAYISFKVLEKLTASGASDTYVQGMIRGEQLDIVLSGASNFKGKVELKSLHIEQSGASDAIISGTTGKLKVRSSGASDFRGFGLQAENCEAIASGASDIKITVTKELNAIASGASAVYHKGAAVVKSVSTSGASRIYRKS